MADNDQRFLHQPVDNVNGRSGWLVHDAATNELVGFRADSGPQAAGNAVNGGSSFETMTSLDIRDRSAAVGRQYVRLRLAEPADRGGPEVRQLDPVGPPLHRRDLCGKCHAERGHGHGHDLNVTLPPAQPKQSAS